MQLLFMLLRIIHIFSGAFWFGAAAMLILFIYPVIGGLGPEGQKFHQRFLARRFGEVVGISAALNILSGLILYWLNSGGLQLAWITSDPGMGFTLGGAAGLAAVFIGIFRTQLTSERLGRLAAEIEAAGRPSTAEQMAELQRLQERLSQGVRWGLILLSIALLFMAVARYL